MLVKTLGFLGMYMSSWSPFSEEYEAYARFLTRADQPVGEIRAWALGQFRIQDVATPESIHDVRLRPNLCHALSPRRHTIIDLDDHNRWPLKDRVTVVGKPRQGQLACPRTFFQMSGTEIPTLSTTVVGFNTETNTLDAVAVRRVETSRRVHATLASHILCLCIWQEDGSRLLSFPPSTYYYGPVPGESRFLSLATDGALHLSCMVSGVTTSIPMEVTCLCADAHGNMAVAGGIDGTVYAVDFDTGKIFRLVEDDVTPVRSLHIVRKPAVPFRYLVAGREDGSVEVIRWMADRQRGVVVSRRRVHTTGSVHLLCADATKIVSCDYGGGVVAMPLIGTDPNPWFRLRVGRSGVTSADMTHHHLALGHDGGVKILHFTSHGREGSPLLGLRGGRHPPFMPSGPVASSILS